MTRALAVAIVLTSSVFADQGNTRQQLAPLQGTWTLTSIDGRSAADAGMKGELVIKGSAYEVIVNGAVDESGTIRLDRSKKPAAIDLVIAKGSSAGKTQLGIVEIGTDTLKFHLATPGATTRPVNFDAIPDHDVVVVTKKK
jgi:uncharacterized protein (TIGR03067 family)